MNVPPCRPFMDATSPHCRCPQCETVHVLRADFPHLISLRLSDDLRRLALVHLADVDAHAHELVIGERDTLALRRRWRPAQGTTLGTPVPSADGERVCVPLQGNEPGLFLVSDHEEPRRLSRGFDIDPRWRDDVITFYRLDQGTSQLMRIDTRAA